MILIIKTLPIISVFVSSRKFPVIDRISKKKQNVRDWPANLLSVPKNRLVLFSKFTQLEFLPFLGILKESYLSEILRIMIFHVIGVFYIGEIL